LLAPHGVLCIERQIELVDGIFNYGVYDDADAKSMSQMGNQRDAEPAQRSWKKTLEFSGYL
jgi:hypothetical protein